MIKAFAHICFNVSNLEESIHFYCDILGLKRGFDFVDKKGCIFGVYLHVGGRSFIELFKGEPKKIQNAGPYGHFCLEVDNLEKTVKELKAKQIKVTDIMLGSDNAYQAWIEDPDGNKIELHYYTPKSKQLDSFK
ncbi:MAG: hypothetical protein A2452_03045 [Candidatus Firestonebacteria bacterium RIFOXYC2_FULL_39_67]|nr:MAG: hypothetical protein A2536_02460 [Candidatus Firestonebacteria bacterium RIFOXYD2_FULL_39_29]OGF55429.1 MAG: hypothetical protein A2452_03045 [Candidatus Firestonebacteria bacterium RIFOXYC2_FULL_39_67]